MKGIIIYGDPIGINSRATYCDYINDAYFDFKQESSKIITGCLGGTPSEKSKAVCSPDDTYDFETGALISLMKMCGLEKSAKAYAEIFDDTAYGDALNERDKLKRHLCYAEEDINMKVGYLKKKDEEIEQLKEKNDGLYNLARKYVDEIDQKDHEIISLKALKLTNDSLKKDNESFRKTCEKLKEENFNLKTQISVMAEKETELIDSNKRLSNKSERLNDALNTWKQRYRDLNDKNGELVVENYKLKTDCEKLQHGYIDTDTVKPDLPRTLDINGVTYRKGVSLKDLSKEFKIESGFMITGWDPEKDFVSQMDKILGVCKPLTKREKMWDDILKEGRTPVYVERKDVLDFLEECQIAGIKWQSGKMPLETVPFNMSEGNDGIYFFVMTSHTPNEFRHVMTWWVKVYDEDGKKVINYLPPMRWDLFKKGRKIIRVTPENFGEAMAHIRANVALIYGGYGWERVIKNNFNKQHGFIRVHAIAKDTGYASLEFMEPEDLVKKQLADPTVYSSNKIVDWEDVK